MASNTVTPDRVKSVLSTFLSSNTKESKTDKNVDTNSDSTRGAVLSPLESAAKTDYFKRVETYSPMTWFGKPIELSPLVCARYGWENSMNDMLQCVSCKAVICAQLPATTEFTLYKEACEKVQDKLISGHDKFCWVVANPTSEKFMILPLYDIVQLRKEFHDSLCLLGTIKNNLPKLNFENMENWGFDEEKCTMLATSQHIRDDAAISATLAITGWTLSDSDNILLCNYCKRRIGTWNYLKETVKTETEPIKDEPGAIKEETTLVKQEDKSEEESDQEPCRKRMKLEKINSLDPIMEHRYWCPWVTLTEKPGQDSTEQRTLDDSVSSTGEEEVSFTFKKNESVPGWVNTLKILVPGLAETVRSTGLSNSPMIEGLRSVRKILRVWSSPDKPVKTLKDSTSDTAST